MTSTRLLPCTRRLGIDYLDHRAAKGVWHLLPAFAPEGARPPYCRREITIMSALVSVRRIPTPLRFSTAISILRFAMRF